MLRVKNQLSVVLRSLRGSLVGNKPLHAAGVVSAFVALALTGAGMLLEMGVANATAQWRGGVETIVFVTPAATQAVVEDVGSAIGATEGVEGVRYVGREETLEEFRTMFEGSPQLARSVDSGMLPTSWRVRFDSGLESRRTEALSRGWERLEGVYAVVTASEAIGAVTSVASMVRRAMLLVALFVGVAGVLMSFAASRAAAWAQRDEIAVMRLVGAPRWVVRAPFALGAVVEWLVGGAMAAGALWWLARYAQVVAVGHEELSVVRDFSIGTWDVLQVAGRLTVLGAVLGSAAALLATGGYVRATEGTGLSWWQRPIAGERRGHTRSDDYHHDRSDDQADGHSDERHDDRYDDRYEWQTSGNTDDTGSGLMVTAPGGIEIREARILEPVWTVENGETAAR